MTDEEVKDAIVRLGSSPHGQQAREDLEDGASIAELRDRYELTQQDVLDLELLAQKLRE